MSASIHEIQTVQVWLQSVNNLRHFARNTQHPFGSISASIQNIFLKIRTQHFLHMGYKLYKFAANRPIIKSALLEERYVFSAVFLIPLNGTSWKFIPCIIHEFVTSSASKLRIVR
jgi:hypothetical protein